MLIKDYYICSEIVYILNLIYAHFNFSIIIDFEKIISQDKYDEIIKEKMKFILDE